MAGDPYPKEKQLARGERRYQRKVASPKAWQAIIDAKGNRCRIASRACVGAIQYHHLVNRSQGGDDDANNIVPLCQGHHGCVTVRSSQHLAALCATLTHEEQDYIFQKIGLDGYQALFAGNMSTR